MSWLLSLDLLSTRLIIRWLVEANGLGVHLAATMFFVIVKGKDLASRCNGLICGGFLLEK